jgi:hypothetical protein
LFPFLRARDAVPCLGQGWLREPASNNDPVWNAARAAERAMLKLSTELRTVERKAQSATLPITGADRSGYRLGRPRRESH